MGELLDGPGIYVAAVAHAEAHLSAIVQHVLGGGVGLIYDGRQPATRHVYVTAEPPAGLDLQGEVDALDAAHRRRVSAARRASLNGGSA